jgi:cell division protein FtsZ
LVNLDFADVRAVMKDGGLAMIGMGDSDGENRAIEAVERALNNPLLDVEIDNAKGALINICGGTDVSIRECREIVETIASRLTPDAKIIWGAQIMKELGETVKVMVVITGVTSPQIMNYVPVKTKATGEDKKEIEKILGIDFVKH